MTQEQWSQTRMIPSFEDRICAVAGFLSPGMFGPLKDEILGLVETDRSYIPSHKKGATIGYDTLRKSGPKVVALYRSDQHRQFISQIVGARLEPTPIRDKSSLSVLIYDRPGDHIGWHYDHNFYRGRHFTILVSIENTNRDRTAISEAKLVVKNPVGEAVEIPTPPNTLVVFEGAMRLHRVTPLGKGERRVVLSMTYCTNPKNSPGQELARRIKDTAYFGMRALWS
jgi:hypothetical protein